MRRKYLKNSKSGPSISSVGPSVPAAPSNAKNSGTGSVKQFAGKTLDELDDKGSDLAKYLVDNKTSPLVKNHIFPSLQAAEEAGLPVDQQAVLAILQSNKPNKEKLQEAVDEINGCHK